MLGGVGVVCARLVLGSVGAFAAFTVAAAAAPFAAFAFAFGAGGKFGFLLVGEVGGDGFAHLLAQDPELTLGVHDFVAECTGVVGPVVTFGADGFDLVVAEIHTCDEAVQAVARCVAAFHVAVASVGVAVAAVVDGVGAAWWAWAVAVGGGGDEGDGKCRGEAGGGEASGGA